MSFYYWQPVFSLDSTQKMTLRDNDIQQLYVRYFDVDRGDTAPVMTNRLRYQTSPAGYTIIPVVCLSNRLFEQLSPADIPAFASTVFTRVRQINAPRNIRNREIQFNCDWTQNTKDKYFDFLREYHRISVQVLSSVIRLYQLKYPDRTGIPPVDHGVLLYFNMADVDTGNTPSAYERSLVHRYTPSLRSYPMTLDVAMPIFTDGKEGKDDEDLFDIVTDINRHTNHHIRNLIFFDLDTQNVRQYDKALFKEVLDHTN